MTHFARQTPLSTSSGMAFESFCISKPGEEYEINEDYATADSEAQVFIVADGLGGRPHGDLASRTATEAFFERVTRTPLTNRLDEDELRSAVVHSNATVHSLAQTDPMLTGMGTTLSAVVFQGCQGKIIHVGDSRIYHYGNQKLRLLTRDHTLAEELLQRSHFTTKTAAKSPLRNMLSRSIGTNAVVEPDISDILLLPEDLILLATDGLFKALDEISLKSILDRTSRMSPQIVCNEIVQKASETHLRDNVTILIARLKK